MKRRRNRLWFAYIRQIFSHYCVYFRLLCAGCRSFHEHSPCELSIAIFILTMKSTVRRLGCIECVLLICFSVNIFCFFNFSLLPFSFALFFSLHNDTHARHRLIHLPFFLFFFFSSFVSLFCLFTFRCRLSFTTWYFTMESPHPSKNDKRRQRVRQWNEVRKKERKMADQSDMKATHDKYLHPRYAFTHTHKSIDANLTIWTIHTTSTSRFYAFISHHTHDIIKIAFFSSSHLVVVIDVNVLLSIVVVFFVVFAIWIHPPSNRMRQK